MNQYRCETCKKPIGKSGGTDNCPISIPSHLDVPDVFVIDLVGCASHSDFQSEREKVLDKFYNMLKPEYVEIFEGVSWDDVERVYDKLRKQGEQEQP